MTASARHQPFVTICTGGKLTVAKEAIILQQSGPARSADGRRKSPFIHRHLVPGVYGMLAAVSQVTSSISVCARVINAKMWTKVNLAFLLTLMVAWTHNSSNKWKMIGAVWLFLHVISIAVPEGSGGSDALIDEAQHQPRGYTLSFSWVSWVFILKLSSCHVREY